MKTRIKNALISVSDKENLIILLKILKNEKLDNYLEIPHWL